MPGSPSALRGVLLAALVLAVLVLSSRPCREGFTGALKRIERGKKPLIGFS